MEERLLFLIRGRQISESNPGCDCVFRGSLLLTPPPFSFLSSFFILLSIFSSLYIFLSFLSILILLFVLGQSLAKGYSHLRRSRYLDI
jgi:hypothetical protein